MIMEKRLYVCLSHIRLMRKTTLHFLPVGMIALLSRLRREHHHGEDDKGRAGQSHNGRTAGAKEKTSFPAKARYWRYPISQDQAGQ
jgi:hypothetical protein